MSIETYRNIVAREMPEKALQAEVERIARSLGWLTYHVYDSRRTEFGFPDLVCLRGDRIIVAELKREGKTPRPQQEVWLEAFEDVGAEVYRWMPSDLIAGRIHETLGAI